MSPLKQIGSVFLTRSFLYVWFFFFSCTPPESLEHEHYFSLNLGKLSSQLELFATAGRFFPENTVKVTTHNGIVYILNAASQKIMGFTSYGNLIYLLQNKDFPHIEENKQKGDLFISYPFDTLRNLAVSPRGELFIQDRTPAESRLFDRDKNVLLENHILHFNSQGHFVRTIGQEGISGRPFGIISHFLVNAQNELVVVVNNPNEYQVFHYAETGEKISEYTFNKILPKNTQDPYTLEDLSDIVPSFNQSRIYIVSRKLKSLFDEASKSVIGISIEEHKVLSFDLHSGQIIQEFMIPQEKINELLGNRSLGQNNTALYLLGDIPSKLIFHIGGSSQTSYYYLIVDKNTQSYGTLLNVVLPAGQIVDLSLSSDGLLAGLFIKDDKVDVHWWKIPQ